MRIRKNAKISALLSSTTNLTTEPHESFPKNNLCQLNQSPWDIITFPSSDSSSPLHHQFDDYEVYYNVNLPGNGNSVDSVRNFESVALKTFLEGENDNGNDTDNNCGENLGFKDELVLCDKLDEKGWQCGRLVKNGNKICDHHLSELQNYAVWTTKKKVGSVSGPTTGCRPQRTKKQPTTNPHEFYYYSGFGPSWGKKRGAPGVVSNVYSEASSTTTSIGYKDYEASDINNDKDAHEEKRQRLEPKTSDVGAKLILDYIDDNEKGKMVKTGKKRGRKPIKARSLKSLM